MTSVLTQRIGLCHGVRAGLVLRKMFCSTFESGSLEDFLVANVVILPQTHANDFQRFCEANPQACPLLEVLAPGDPAPRLVASGVDVRRDLPLFKRFVGPGPPTVHHDITPYFTDDAVTFLLGCSFHFEEALVDAGIDLRHLREGMMCAWYVCLDVYIYISFHGTRHPIRSKSI